MPDTITFQDALATIDSGAWVSMEVVTADLKRKTGGDWLKLPRCRKNPRRLPEERYADQGVPSTPKRSPRHYENSTRNMLLPNGLLVKVHLRLIRKLNGATVL